MILDTLIGRYDGAHIEGCSDAKFLFERVQLEAASMVLDNDQSVPEVCASLGIGPTALPPLG